MDDKIEAWVKRAESGKLYYANTWEGLVIACTQIKKENRKDAVIYYSEVL